MRHHRDVDVVQVAQPYELRLSAEELDGPRAAQIVPVLDLDVLLRGHGHQSHAPGQGVHDAGRLKPGGRGEHGADLGVVAAGVRRAGFRVRVRMARDDERVELAHDGDRRPRAGAVQSCLYAGDGDALVAGDAHGAQGLRGKRGRPALTEAGLGGVENAFGDTDGARGFPVDLGADRGLQLLD